jgi:hypothetical protein
VNECSNCLFGRVADFSPHIRPRLTFRAVPPSGREDYYWPVVPESGWCVDYKRDYDKSEPGSLTGAEKEAMVKRVEAVAEKITRGKK